MDPLTALTEELDDALALIAARDEQLKAANRTIELLQWRLEDLLSRRVDSFDNL